MSVTIKRVMPGYVPPVKEAPADKPIKDYVKELKNKKPKTQKGAKKNV